MVGDVNGITSLDVRECKKLTLLTITSNQLTNLILPGNDSQLTEAFLNSNQLSNDLSIFSHLEKLVILSIKNTNISIDLSHLPANLEQLFCNDEPVPETLKKYIKRNELEQTYFDCKLWRNDYPVINQGLQAWIEIPAKQ